MSDLGIEHRVPLAPRTTLGIGGPARFFGEPADETAVVAMIDWAAEHHQPITLLGQGSNTVVADRGVDGLVMRVCAAQLHAESDADALQIEAGAGVCWDTLVAWSVERGCAGIECLAGIPGDVGAAPVQNIGAYGQQVGDCIHSVRAVDRQRQRLVDLDHDDCDFSYRNSIFKRQPERYVIVSVRLRLKRGGAPTLAYGELAKRLAGKAPSLAQTRRTVLALRRTKSMVIDPSDPNHRSVGSFFVNPLLEPEQAERVRHRAAALSSDGAPLPSWPAEDGRVKLAAAWLIEQAGMNKGYRRGQVAVSSRHSLALVNLGGGSAHDLVALAAEIRAAVRQRFGVVLAPEPRFVGFERGALAALLE